MAFVGTSNTSTLVLLKSAADAVKRPVFGQQAKFGNQFQFHSFGELAQTGNITIEKFKNIIQQQQNSQKTVKMGLRTYGKKPIVESYLPLKHNVTIDLDFENCAEPNFGKMLF